MVLTKHIADHRRTLAKLGVGKEALIVVHRIQDASLHGLKPIANIWQRARGDDRECVIEVTPLRLGIQGNRQFVKAVHGPKCVFDVGKGARAA